MARPTSIHHTTVAAEKTLDIGSVSANTSSDVTFSLAGIRKGRPLIMWTEGSLNAGLQIGNVHASAANQVKFKISNSTGSPINPDALVFKVVQF